MDSLITTSLAMERIISLAPSPIHGSSNFHSSSHTHLTCSVRETRLQHSIHSSNWQRIALNCGVRPSKSRARLNFRCQSVNEQHTNSGGGMKDWMQRLKHATEKDIQGMIKGCAHSMMAACAASLVLLGSYASPPPSWGAEGMTITFPISPTPEVSRLQRTMVEAWGIVRETFVDTTFNDNDWDGLLEEALWETVDLQTEEEVYDKIRAMLVKLGDPFTRITTPSEYESFRISNDGALEGVGLLIASDPETGKLIVLSPIEGGPAARAGIHAGDELLQIDDEQLEGLNGPEAANKLRGRAGTEVTLTLRQHDDELNAPDEIRPLQVVKLKRESINLSPVFATILPPETSVNTLSAVDNSVAMVPLHSHATGYIRLSAFSQNAATEMERAIERLQAEGAANFILDLRDNPGGLVRSGLEVASLWFGEGDHTLVHTVDRSGMRQTIHLISDGALSSLPLVILVNHGSASASEILAGALHDNGRALLVGESTYGKGKIQSVFELGDGSALFVTVAKYLSPELHEIDRIGIAPDLSCAPPSSLSLPSKLRAKGTMLPRQASLGAEEGGGAAAAPAAVPTETPNGSRKSQAIIFDRMDIVRELQKDACVLTAEVELESAWP